MEKLRKQVRGVVVSDKMDKGVVVSISYMVKHPKFKKFIKRSKRVMAHNPENKAKVGNTVDLNPTRPISRNKRYLVVNIIEN